MNISRRWLEGFLRRPLDPADVAARLAALGATVDAIEPLHPGLEQVVVALVREVRPHPNADRLRLCDVDDGSGTPRSVVCGAPNVTARCKYPFAPVGATLPGGLTLERRKIRGEVSEGMLCSARELGLGQEHDGILELTTDAAPGTPFLKAMPIADERLVVDVTPNRPDLLGHKGVARELAYSFGTTYRLPAVPGSDGPSMPSPVRAGSEGVTGGVRVAIEDAEGCPRFLGAVLRGVTVGPSPEWLRARVESAGMRSISNVVDATNCVMLELNQPMHAYDVSRLEGHAVIARRARAGERLTTLDGAERTLAESMTVIADGTSVIGVAGVMGGAHSEVGPATTDLFLECAYFEPRRVRATRKALNLSSEASYRFERGVDRWNGPEVLRRAVEIIQATAGGALDGEPIDLQPQVAHPPRIFLRPARVAQVLGVDVPWDAIERYLVAIGATVVSKPEDGRIAVDVPGWRPDLLAEIDLIEEVARLHGYDNFPTELRPFRVGELPSALSEELDAAIRRGLVAEGLYEVQSLPLGPEDGPGAVRLLNPLSAEEGYLRTRLLPGLVRRVEGNWAAHTRDVRLFELGTTFRLGRPGEPPAEERRVAGVVTGAREPAHWSGAGKAPDADPWDLRSLFEAAAALAHPGATVQVDGGEWVAIAKGGLEVGRAGPLNGDAPPWAGLLLGFELLIDGAPRSVSGFKPLPGTPAAARDLSLLVPAGLAAADLGEAIRKAGGKLVESVDVLDEYRGAGVPAGHRGLAFRLRYRAPDRTLRDQEVDASVTKVLKVLREQHGIELRAS
ncbi:MAG TPA: phenylalanine--tRNA ligase subunit beta [Gemmatimonadales bacterium]|nr:phenylalanine--tRNA ligase subunit beta [Gemmatimonadales bacterium]